MALRKLLGVDTLIAKDNKEIDVASLEGKVTFLYFSAHWCPPCKQFTPVLTKLYNSLKAQKKEFEIIFISSDKSQEQFDEYFKGMPWVALPWALRKQKDKLSRKLKVQSIPTLATIDETGRIVTTKARASVMQDQEGKEFPWLPKNPWEILKGAKLVTAEGAAAVSVDDLKRKDSIALYFSAHWCPPCRAFTPRLTSIYRKLQAKGTAMDIVFVSLDQAEEEYAEYLAEMPWFALTLGDNRIRELSESLGVEGIPALITIKPDGSIINAEAKEVADDDEEGTQYPWAAVSLPAVTSLNPSGNVVNALNGGICVLLSINGAPNATTALVEFNAAVQTFDAEVNKTRDAEEKVRFFTVDDSDETQVGLYKKVLGALGLGLPKHGEPTVVMMNLPNNRAYRFVSGELSQANIVSSVTTFAKAQDE